jgi:hypothetical protein
VDFSHDLPLQSLSYTSGVQKRLEDFEAECRRAAGGFRSSCSCRSLLLPGSGLGPPAISIRARPPPFSLGEPSSASQCNTDIGLGRTCQARGHVSPQPSPTRTPRRCQVTRARNYTTQTTWLFGTHLVGQARVNSPSQPSPLTLPLPRPLLTWVIAHCQIWCYSDESRQVVCATVLLPPR